MSGGSGRGKRRRWYRDSRLSGNVVLLWGQFSPPGGVCQFLETLLAAAPGGSHWLLVEARDATEEPAGHKQFLRHRINLPSKSVVPMRRKPALGITLHLWLLHFAFPGNLMFAASLINPLFKKVYFLFLAVLGLRCCKWLCLAVARGSFSGCA